VNAQNIYNAWKAAPDWNDVVFLFLFGTPETQTIAPQAVADHKPHLTGSQAGLLATPNPIDLPITVPEVDPFCTTTSCPLPDGGFGQNQFPTEVKSSGYPYTFFPGTDYSTAIRIGMFHLKTVGAQRVGFAHCAVQSTFCTDPLPAGRTYAAANGLAIGRDLIAELTDSQATYSQIVMTYLQTEKAAAAADPTYHMVDWLWGGNTALTMNYLGKAVADANKALGLNVKVLINNQGFDESLYPYCGEECVGVVYGISPFLYYGDVSRGSPEMPKVVALQQKWRQIDYQQALEAGTPDAADAAPPTLQSYATVRYVDGYLYAFLFRAAAQNVINAGLPVTGDNLRKAFESFNNVESGGLTSPVTFNSTDHRPQSTEFIYTLAEGGAIVNVPPDRTIFLQNDWLGY
jgi:branched-chain amino acid transport system substrate-binding protein